MFTVYIYTAGKKKYADAVLKVVDPKNVIENRLITIRGLSISSVLVWQRIFGIILLEKQVNRRVDPR